MSILTLLRSEDVLARYMTTSSFTHGVRHIANGGVHSAIVGLTMSVDRARTLSAVLRGRFLVRSFPTVPAVRLNDAKRAFHQQAYRPLWSG
jgi:hypothetical protein